MSAFRYLRPFASRLQPSTLPRLTRGYASSSYEFIQVTEPKPGVGQGMDHSQCLKKLQAYSLK
jgi:enoyl-CoA hydratase